MRMVRVTLAVSSTGAGLLDKNMLHLPLRVWAFLSPALCSILEAGGGARRLGAGTCFRLYVVQTLGSFSFYPNSLSPHFSYPSTTTAFQGPTSFHVIQISTFANSTWAQNLGSGWLDDLQIHGWDSDSGTAIFLKPWSKGNFSDEEVAELEELFRVYLIGFLREVQDHVSEFQLECEYNPLNWGHFLACIYLSRVVSIPLPGIPDFSYSLNSSAIDEIPPL